MNEENKIDKKIKLSIIATTLNEEEHIEFWYENHKDLADEFILIDTESWDNTQEVIKKYPDIKFITEKWRHDFSWAKNQAIRHATGDWILSLSPDFWIDKKNFTKIKEAIQSNKYVAYATPCYHHFIDWINQEDAPTNIKMNNRLTDGHVCLFKNDPYIRYEGRVHENIHERINEIYGKDKIGELDVVRHHDNTHNVMNNKKKLRYYEYLENISMVERKVWEHGQILRKDAYDAEL